MAQEARMSSQLLMNCAADCLVLLVHQAPASLQDHTHTLHKASRCSWQGMQLAEAAPVSDIISLYNERRTAFVGRLTMII